MPTHFSHPRIFFVAALLAAVLLMTGCQRGGSANERVFQMGAPVAVGPLSYNVIDQNWYESLTTETGQRLPKHRFLILNLTVTNGGAGVQGVPLLTIVGSDGKEYMEETRGEGVPSWLGMIRSAGPAQTEQGNVLFDAPPGTYKLRVSSGGDPESEQTAMIVLPFRVEAPTTVGTDAIKPPTN